MYEIKTIDDVIYEAEAEFGIHVIANNRNLYKKFIERQIERELKKNLDYRLDGELIITGFRRYSNFKLMTFKVAAFSYLMGETSINAGNVNHEMARRIGWYSPGDVHLDGKKVKKWALKPEKERILDLYLLNPGEMGYDNPSKNTDPTLLNLATIITNCNRNFNLPDWCGVIDEIGSDETVVEYFGKPINSALVKDVKKLKEKKRKMIYHLQNRETINSKKKLYRQIYKKEIAERQKLHYEENKITFIGRNIKYVEGHKEGTSSYQAKYREEHRDELNEYFRNYRAENQEIISKIRKLKWREKRVEEIVRRLKDMPPLPYKLQSIIYGDNSIIIMIDPKGIVDRDYLKLRQFSQDHIAGAIRLIGIGKTFREMNFKYKKNELTFSFRPNKSGHDRLEKSLNYFLEAYAKLLRKI